MLTSPCTSVPPSLHKSLQLSISRKLPVWLWETVSCLLRKKKEIFPQCGCLLDKVFCLCTITGTQGAAEKAFALWNMAQRIRLGMHALLYINAFLFIFKFVVKRKRNYCQYTYRKVCFPHNDISSSYLPHWGNYDFSSFPVSPGLSAKGMHACSFNYHEIMTPNLEKMQLLGALQLCQLSKHGLLTGPWYFPRYLIFC